MIRFDWRLTLKRSFQTRVRARHFDHFQHLKWYGLNTWYGFNLESWTTYVMQVSQFWENAHKGHLLLISQSFTERNQKLNCKIEMAILRSWEGQWLHWNDEVPHLLVSVELSSLIQGQCPDNVTALKKHLLLQAKWTAMCAW